MYNKNPEQPRPEFIIVPSLTCHAECGYCFGPHKGKMMNQSKWNDIMTFIMFMTKDLPPKEPINILFHGGEPLLAGYPFFEKNLKVLESTFGLERLNISIQSNLWALDERFLDVFQKYNVKISTSLDGPKNINDRQRGTGYFQKTWKGIQLAKKRGIQIGCIVTFTTQSSSYWKKILDFFKDNKIAISIRPAIPAIGKDNSNQFILSPLKYSHLLMEIFPYYLKNFKYFNINSFWDNIQFVINDSSKNCSYSNCIGMFLAIDPQGEIYLCQRFIGLHQYSIGNISDYTHLRGNEEIWNHPNLQVFYNRIKRLEKHASYQASELNRKIIGGCPYQAFTENKENIHDPYFVGKKKFFEEIRNRYVDESIRLLESQKTPTSINKLFIDYPVLTNSKMNKYPHKLLRMAKRIFAAFLLSINSNINEINEQLFQLGLIRNKTVGLLTLEHFQKRLKRGRYKNIYLHLTWKCNLNCNHCYAPTINTTQYLEKLKSNDKNASNQSERVDFPVDRGTLHRFFESVSLIGFSKIIVTGGEPSCHPNFISFLDVLNEFKKKNSTLKFVLRSNWTLEYSEECFKLLSRAFDQIIVSIDGNQETHNTRRGDGTFQRTIGNLKRYIEFATEYSSAPHIEIACTFPFNKLSNDIKNNIYDLVDKLGGNINIRFRQTLPIGKGRNLQLSSNYIENFDAFTSLNFLESNFTPKATCGLGRNLYINPSGGVYPCHAYKPKDSYLGNIFQTDLISIMKSPQFQNLFDYNVDNNKLCHTCKVKYICGGGCQVWNEEKSLFMSPSFCDGKSSANFINALKKVKIAIEYLEINFDFLKPVEDNLVEIKEFRG